MDNKISGTLSTVDCLSASLNSKEVMLAALNKEKIVTEYQGKESATTFTEVDNNNYTISVDIKNPTDNNFTDELKQKLENIDPTATSGVKDVLVNNSSIVLNKVARLNLDSYLNDLFKGVEYSSDTGVLSFIRYDNTYKNIDLPLELIVERGYYKEENKSLILVLANGDEIEIPVGDLLIGIATQEYVDENIHQLQLNINNILTTKVDKIDGKQLSTNDLTDELQMKYDEAFSKRHIHDNKDILDEITAPFTIEEQTKVSKIIIDGDGKKALMNDGTYGEAGKVDTISINNAEPLQPDENKNININIITETDINNLINTHDTSEVSHPYLGSLISDIVDGTIEIAKALESKDYNIQQGNIKEKFEDLIEAINDIVVIVNSLKGATVSLGQIQEATENITQQMLTDYTVALDKIPQSGYVIYDLNDNEWEYNGESWVNNGKFVNTPATNTQLGTVIGGNYVNILNGVMTILNSLDAERLGGELPSYYATVAQLNNLLTDKQDKTDNALQTISKTVIGAINEQGVAIGKNTVARIDNKYNGFVTQPTSVAFNNTTRTLSLNGAFDIYVNSEKYHKENTSFIISDVEGLHHLYYNLAGEPEEIVNTYTLELITKYCFVATIYWDKDNQKQIFIAAEYRHGMLMDGDTHARLHEKDGLVLISGGELGDLSTDGDTSADSSCQFSNLSTIVRDEDARFVHQARTKISNLPVYYRIGADTDEIWRIKENDSFPVIAGANGRACYNRLLSGTWSAVQYTSGLFVLAHIIVTNDIERPYAVIMGQSGYASLTEARQGAREEINNLVLAGLPFQEVKFIATILIQSSDDFTNTPKSRLRTLDDGSQYIDLRGEVITRSGVTGGSVQDHNDLAGIQGGADNDYQHLTMEQVIQLDAVPEIYSTKIELENKVDKIEGYGLTENNLSNELKEIYDESISLTIYEEGD